MVWVIGAVLLVVVIGLLTAGARHAKETDDEIRDTNRNHSDGPGNGILGVFGKGRKRR